MISQADCMECMSEGRGRVQVKMRTEPRGSDMLISG